MCANSALDRNQTEHMSLRYNKNISKHVQRHAIISSRFTCTAFGIKREWKDHLQKEEEFNSPKVELSLVLNDTGRLKRSDGERF